MVLPTKDAIIRFDENEDRINKFVNEYGEYTTNSGLPAVETLPSFIQRNSNALNLLTATNVKGTWSPSTFYSTWDEVQYSGTWYRCVVTHTSTPSFDSTKWRISQGVRAGDLSADNGSSLVGWTQSGTGATSRTLLSKLRDGFISVKDFGAVGDGTTDDTDAIIKTITAAKTLGKSRIYFPSGCYVISSSINVTNFSGFIFFGDGGNYFFDQSKGTCLKYTGISGYLMGFDSCNSFSIQDMWFTYSSSSFTGELVWTDNTAGLDTNSGEFLRCTFGGLTPSAINASNLLRIKKSYMMDVTQCLFIRGKIGVGIYAYGNIINFTRNQFQACGTNAVYAYTGSLEDITFYKNTFEPLSNGKASAFDSANGVYIFGFTYMSNWHGDVTAAGAGYWSRIVGGRGVKISGNTFGASGGGADDYALSIGNSLGVDISANVFYDKSLNFYAACGGVHVAGNSMSSDIIGGYSNVAGIS